MTSTTTNRPRTENPRNPRGHRVGGIHGILHLAIVGCNDGDVLLPRGYRVTEVFRDEEMT
jgi:hypothetical protein